MQYEDYKPAVSSAYAAEAVGGIFCVTGVFIGITLINSGNLQGVMGVALGLSSTLPTLVGGLLLIFAGRILRATPTNSKAQAELPREKDWPSPLVAYRPGHRLGW